MTKHTPNSDLPIWYALYTLPRWEKKVAERLDQQGIENYCPLNRVWKQWSDRKKLVYEPLFSSYIFVRVTEKQKWSVKDTKGVLNYVHWQGKPAAIPDQDIETVKRFLNEHQQVTVQTLELNINDQVRILSGPFMNQQAMVLAQQGKKVKVEITSLGISLVATIHQAELEPLHLFQA